jgi:nickel/cobalt transporter (NiCoT) family protein
VLFLFAIAMINIVVLAGVYRLFKRVRRGDAYAEEELDFFLSQRGLLGRLLRGLFRLIRRSWHMYPLGLLFGLGFDTATEIGLLGISAAEASKGLSIWSILVFPALFTVGMSLVDTSDGVLMVGAYGWAFRNPVRKLYYNLAITAVSVVIAGSSARSKLLHWPQKTSASRAGNGIPSTSPPAILTRSDI